MTFNIDNWLNIAMENLKKSFSERLLFVGLQGSYNRGEATAESDIDLVVILDVLNFDDLKVYKNITEKMPHKEKACGFISGRNELQKWSKDDLFQFFYDTKSLYGRLEDIIHPPLKEDIKKSIKRGSENIFHAAVHSFVHSDNYAEDLQNLYKMTFFILQAKNFVQTNNYVQTKSKLSECLKETDKEILNICINRKKIINADSNELENLYKKLIEWCSKYI